ncbi:hypothetical protein NEOLEDRAFT_1138895 [Neolentinus lepideus HHB14362 ss-1]|uniref:Uncharacterized protein n=1 Tax=Neolentinus lepideus HHB14362 ss-1 TaxID=1314782 RepID=A0A165Q3S6_9AGAM|nr:hypothetical protein NEOLEDRAFT_1138895 [Neolentinus lepideus HHB14362 ss-1]
MLPRDPLAFLRCLWLPTQLGCLFGRTSTAIGTASASLLRVIRASCAPFPLAASLPCHLRSSDCGVQFHVTMHNDNSVSFGCAGKLPSFLGHWKTVPSSGAGSRGRRRVRRFRNGYSGEASVEATAAIHGVNWVRYAQF